LKELWLSYRSNLYFATLEGKKVERGKSKEDQTTTPLMGLVVAVMICRSGFGTSTRMCLLTFLQVMT